MKSRRSSVAILAIWTAAVALTGSILTSFHQPFRIPDAGILALVDDPGRSHWRMLHVLSSNCGCSRRVMQHLVARHRLPGVTEQVLLVEVEETQRSGSAELVATLPKQGFPVRRIAAKEIPAETGLNSARRPAIHRR